MKLSTRDDIEAPLEHVFKVLSDTEGWERAAMRRGAEVARTDKMRGTGVGMGWQVQFSYRGKDRKLAIRLTELDHPSRLAFAGTTPALEGGLTLDLLALSPKRTRVTVATEIKPRTLGARILLQSLKLAKSKITQKFETRVSAICKDIEDRYRAGQAR